MNVRAGSAYRAGGLGAPGLTCRGQRHTTAAQLLGRGFAVLV